MNIYSFTVGPFAENTYLLSHKGKALLIDPGFFEDHEFEACREQLIESGDELLAVLLTHAHVDHVLGLEKVLNHYEVPVYLSDKDHYLWSNFSSQARMFGFQANGFNFEPEVLPEKEGWQLGPFTFDLLYTPGHSPDHIAIYHKESGSLLAGDTLFREGIGRTDLYKGNFQLLEQSIRKKLYTLPNDTKVLPGHGPHTSIGYEKQNNPFIKTGS